MRPAQEAQVRVPADGVVLDADLTLVEEPLGVVVFAHGSGSSRHSPRNRQVARTLQERGLCTLLADLLTADEERVDLRTREHRFDLPLLARRLADLAHWVGVDPLTRGRPIGFFGSSTGGGAALMAAAMRPDVVGAVVSRGGRPDLAGPALAEVEAATLLLVGERDEEVLALNRDAIREMSATVELRTVEGATHLFEEPGALEQVAGLAADWFAHHLPGTGQVREEVAYPDRRA